VVRRLWVLAGLALLGFGVWTMLGGDTNGTRPVSTATWAAGALVGHDALLAPVVFGTGWLLARVMPRRVRAVAVPVLVLAGVAVLLLVPRWRSPAAAQNATVNPPLSTVDITLAAAAGLAVLGAAHLVAGRLSGRARRSSGRGGATGP
jgi:hypothetical protein